MFQKKLKKTIFLPILWSPQHSKLSIMLKLKRVRSKYQEWGYLYCEICENNVNLKLKCKNSSKNITVCSSYMRKPVDQIYKMITDSLENQSKQSVTISDDSKPENNSIFFEIWHHEKDIWMLRATIDNLDFLNQHDVNSVPLWKNELQTFLSYLPTSDKKL